MDADNLTLACQLVSSSYVSQGAAALSARRKMIKSLLSNKRMPQTGWDEATIEMLLQDAALMDSNTFPGQVGLGEREARVVCPLVAKRHYRLAHGIGRSGDIAAEQPKAAGSSMLAKLTAHLAADALRLSGLADLALPLVLPCATGMTLTLVMLAAAAAPADVRQPAAAAEKTATGVAVAAASGAALAAAEEQRQSDCSPASCQQQQQLLLPRFVIWSRIDQKTCLKSITAANLVPVVVELQQQGDQLVTDVTGIENAIKECGAAAVAAVVTTTSCFAPRACDDVVAVAKLCHRYGIPHIINNAYGVQCKALTAAVTSACRKGRVDAIVQSTDKNFMVPVGGAVVSAPAGKLNGSSSGGSSSGSSGSSVNRDWLVQAVGKGYPGRASISAHLDLLITLLHLGADGWTQKLNAREDLFQYLRGRLTEVASQLGERVLATPGNPISLGLTLDGLAAAANATNAAAAAAADQAVAAAAPENNQGSSTAPSSKFKTGTRADVSFFGSMLWARNVSGTRVLSGGKQQTIAGTTFKDYGCHISGYPHVYMTAAAAVGATKQEVDVFVARVVRCYEELKDKWHNEVIAAGRRLMLESAVDQSR